MQCCEMNKEKQQCKRAQLWYYYYYYWILLASNH